MRIVQEKLSILLDRFFLSCLVLVFPPFARAQQVVFTAGESGYTTFRIPAIVKAPNGDLLAIGEGRVHHAGDFGNIDIVMKRSQDKGRTWSSLQVIVDADSL